MDTVPAFDAIILSGGRGKRLGERQKAHLDIAGETLLERLLHELGQAERIVVVAPENVDVPSTVERTLEDPPGGGPLAGIEAGLTYLTAAEHTAHQAEKDVLICAIDTPGLGEILPALLSARASEKGRDGAIVFTCEAEKESGRSEGSQSEESRSEGGYPQYLQGLYSARALREVLARCVEGTRNRSVRSVFSQLKLVYVPISAEVSRDLDTPEDLRYWQAKGK